MEISFSGLCINLSKLWESGLYANAYEEILAEIKAKSSVSTEINPSQSEAQQVEKNCYTGVSTVTVYAEW